MDESPTCVDKHEDANSQVLINDSAIAINHVQPAQLTNHSHRYIDT